MLKPGAPYHASCWQRTAQETREVEATHDIQYVIQVPAIKMFIWNLMECKTLHALTCINSSLDQVCCVYLKVYTFFHSEDAKLLAFLLIHGAPLRCGVSQRYRTMRLFHGATY